MMPWCWLNRASVPCCNADCRRQIIWHPFDDFPNDVECMKCARIKRKGYLKNYRKERLDKVARKFGYHMARFVDEDGNEIPS